MTEGITNSLISSYFRYRNADFFQIVIYLLDLLLSEMREAVQQLMIEFCYERGVTTSTI